MKRFQTPTSRNPVLVRRRAENRTYEVRKSLPGSTKTGRYIEIQRLKRFIYILFFHHVLSRSYKGLGLSQQAKCPRSLWEARAFLANGYSFAVLAM